MQPHHYEVLTSVVTGAAEQNAPSLNEQAEAVAAKFQLAFQLFGKKKKPQIVHHCYVSGTYRT